jgi:transposase
MVHPDTAKWDQTVADLRRLSVEARHPRTRERFLALYLIASKQRNATEWAAEIKRMDDTVLGWVHKYNAEGPEALVYRRSGGKPPLFRPSKSPR